MSDNWGSLPSQGGKAGQQGGSSQSTNKGITGPDFNSMYEQKRSMDPASQAKRESLNEQKPQSTLGKLWNSAMSGPGGPNPSGGGETQG
ncbi:hypothetical protein GGS20DRAFT_545385 [Poronia punctata]|nr:hypothetical protein GGS20DRAFT_545385 [Poronia punctata]